MVLIAVVLQLVRTSNKIFVPDIKFRTFLSNSCMDFVNGNNKLTLEVEIERLNAFFGVEISVIDADLEWGWLTVIEIMFKQFFAHIIFHFFGG